MVYYSKNIKNIYSSFTLKAIIRLKFVCLRTRIKYLKPTAIYIKIVVVSTFGYKFGSFV